MMSSYKCPHCDYVGKTFFGMNNHKTQCRVVIAKKLSLIRQLSEKKRKLNDQGYAKGASVETVHNYTSFCVKHAKIIVRTRSMPLLTQKIYCMQCQV